MLLGLFSSPAIVLATTGIYGVVSYGVSQRRGEFGLRMALGTQLRDILGLVLGEGSRIALAVVLAGLLCAFLLTRFMSSVLYSVGTNGPRNVRQLCRRIGLRCTARVLFAGAAGDTHRSDCRTSK